MARKKILAATKPRAKAVKRELSLQLPIGAEPSKKPAAAAKRASAAKTTRTTASVRTVKSAPAPATPVKAARKPATKPAIKPAIKLAVVAAVAPVPTPAVKPTPQAEAQSVALRLDLTPSAVQDELAAAGEDAIETYEIYGAIAAKGVESLGKEVVSFAGSSVQAQLALTEALMQANTVQEAFEAQSAYARESFGSLTTEFAKLTGLSMDLTKEFMAPIQARVAETTRGLW